MVFHSSMAPSMMVNFIVTLVPFIHCYCHFLPISELSFACEGQNNIIKARVCGEELAVHFSERKIITGKFDQSGLLNWGHAVDGDGTPLWRSRADPWQRVEAGGFIR